jgi:hypothetical protein
MFNWHKKEKPLLGLAGLGGGITTKLAGGATALTYTTTIPGAPGELTPDAPLAFNGSSTTGVVHTITFDNPAEIQFKAFGGGGGVGDNAAPDGGVGGSGGFTSATLSLTGGVTYKLFAGGHGTSASGGNYNPIRYGGAGGAGSGIVISSDNTLLAVAGGGGGGSGRKGGAGGGTSGYNGGSPWGSGGGRGGTQSAAGAGGPSPGGSIPQGNGYPGSGTNGGDGGDVNPPYSPVFPGGTSGIPGQYSGGRGNEDGGDQGGGGGGGGYYGGGGGAASSDSSGGGGGSGYYNPTYAPSGNTYNGDSTEWTNDPQRSSMSGSATAGRVVLNAPA